MQQKLRDTSLLRQNQHVRKLPEPVNIRTYVKGGSTIFSLHFPEDDAIVQRYEIHPTLQRQISPKRFTGNSPWED
jgi:hypothetical protein